MGAASLVLRPPPADSVELNAYLVFDIHIGDDLIYVGRRKAAGGCWVSRTGNPPPLSTYIQAIGLVGQSVMGTPRFHVPYSRIRFCPDRATRHDADCQKTVTSTPGKPGSGMRGWQIKYRPPLS